MAKRKGKVELIEETLDAEIESGEQDSSQSPPPESKIEKEDVLAARSQQNPNTARFKIPFKGRQYIENRFPESLVWADRFAQEWRSGGNFEFIEIPNPRAKDALVSGLKNIREVNKRLAPYADLARKRVERVLQIRQQWNR